MRKKQGGPGTRGAIFGIVTPPIWRPLAEIVRDAYGQRHSAKFTAVMALPQMSASVAIGCAVRDANSRGYRVVARLNSAIPCERPTNVCDMADACDTRNLLNTTGTTIADTIAMTAMAMSISASVKAARRATRNKLEVN